MVRVVVGGMGMGDDEGDGEGNAEGNLGGEGS